MNVLSMFDGMSCGQIALERSGFKVDNYYASEIDKYAIKVTQANYPKTIQLGDINNWKNWALLFDWSEIDLVLAGSPCQGFSFAGKQLAFNDPRSRLFFTFVDVLNTIRTKNPKVKFLLENVKMKKEYLEVITEYLGVKPIFINSNLVSAQNRQRYYWSNFSEKIQLPKDKGIILADILEEDGYYTDRLKSHCLDANYFKGGNLKQYFEKHRRQLVFSPEGLCHIGEADIKGNDVIKRVYAREGKAPCLTAICGGNQEPKVSMIRIKSKCVRASGRKSFDRHEWDSVDEKHWRKLTPIECERLQTVSDGYTDHVSNTQRYKMLGNGWNVDTIVHLFSYL